MNGSGKDMHNTAGTPPADDDLTLLRALRALPREREPGQDLWTGIATQLPPRVASVSTSAATSAAVTSSARRRRTPARWRAPLGVALAASMALVAVVILQHDPSRSAPMPVNQTALHEADAIAREYGAAFAQLGPLPQPLQPAATELERSAHDIRVALREQPDAVYLLTRLRTTYEQRLRLSQRYAMS